MLTFPTFFDILYMQAIGTYKEIKKGEANMWIELAYSLLDFAEAMEREFNNSINDDEGEEF